MTELGAGFAVSVYRAVGVTLMMSIGNISRLLEDIQMILGGISVIMLGVLILTVLDREGDKDELRSMYVLAISLVNSVGYPIGNTVLIRLFSKSE